MPYQPSRAAQTFRHLTPLRRDWRDPLCKLVYIMCVLLVLGAIVVPFVPRLDVPWYTSLILLGASFLLFGVHELILQDTHAIVRIYGPVGRLRYLFEREFRDKFLQYFNETNTDGRPIPRIVRDYVYQTSKGIKPLASFGTELDNFDYESTPSARVLHYNFGDAVAPPSFEVEIGAHRENVRTFVVRNVVNVSGMSYGSINWKAAECISIGARDTAFVNTGEGGYGPHGVAGNDVVFQIGTGKFGCGRSLENGLRILDEQLLVDLVKHHDNIHMIQVKISQGAKPGLGGHLPGEKVTPAIADIRKIPVGQSAISPPQHTELIAPTPKEAVGKLMEFCKHIRALTERPVGIKMCVGRREELDWIVEAMKQTGEGPDDIQLDGFDGGTGAGHNMFLNYVGYGTAIETLCYLDYALRKAGIRDRVTLTPSGRLLTPMHAAVAFAFGADYVLTARGMMLALGCIQSIKCHTNECPTGIATNNPWRMRGIVIPEKAARARQYLQNYHQDMMELTRVTHHEDPRDIGLADLRVITQREFFASEDDPDPLGLLENTV